MTSENLKKVGALAAFLVLGACATTPAQQEASIAAEPEEEIAAETAELSADPNADIRSKYEMIQYGQELRAVCSRPTPADGKLADRPNVQVMWENYLYDRPEGIWGEIGGLVEVNGTLPLDQGRWTNACSVRVSHMMNKAGHKIPRQSDNKSVSGGVYDGGKKDQYIYRIRDMEAYLKSAFGAPDESWLDGSADSFDMPDRPGIILMDYPGSTFNGHITIWNGAGSPDNADIGGHRVLFWDMPCFMPAGREQIVAGGQSGANASP